MIYKIHNPSAELFKVFIENEVVTNYISSKSHLIIFFIMYYTEYNEFADKYNGAFVWKSGHNLYNFRVNQNMTFLYVDFKGKNDNELLCRPSMLQNAFPLMDDSSKIGELSLKFKEILDLYMQIGVIKDWRKFHIQENIII